MPKAGKDASLYDLLGVDRLASTAEIRKAYHKLALASHPDKHPDDPTAVERFQSLQRIKECLLDAERRAIYDETGIVGDEPDSAERFRGKSFEELYKYFREQHAAVTVDAIDEYEAKYRGSDEEIADLCEFYARKGGRMRDVVQCVLFAEESDLWRFKQILDAQIAAGSLKPEKAYASFDPPPGLTTAEVVRRAKDKLEAAKKRPRGSGKGSAGETAADGDLFALIRGRQASRAEANDAMADALAAKYAPKSKAAPSGSGARSKGVQKVKRGSPRRG
jgi:DnaJ family protein C protein 9